MAIRGVFFDLGNTLRKAVKEPDYIRAAACRMAELAEAPDVDAFMAMVDERYAKYRDWALTEWREANDFDLWHVWLLPEYPEEKIRAICHEITYQYRQYAGHRYLIDGARETIEGLYARGYKLGIISNLIGEQEIPAWLAEDGLDKYFSAVILSPVCGLRKPEPEIYRLACREMGLDPSECASIADNIKRDFDGAKIAGIGLNIWYATPEKITGKRLTDKNRPDYIIQKLTQALDIPELGG